VLRYIVNVQNLKRVFVTSSRIVPVAADAKGVFAAPGPIDAAASCRCCRLLLLLSLFAVWVTARCLVPAANCLCCCQCRLLPLFAV